ncbi:hypothetical protein NCU16728 [Neurospora crassa OR74A]|uniref:Uncharacterized protein n=1 Tax=Neurospora crassa (strain ATCC 24698 / 74-OR23-1A / CBS 708.71 / DSM 1257 / FGSC 987) TaxID=367110 RepID=V5INM2_NEUCR|nr:hypothetical protein NCU16728 [Neurospora crassa OR74A]ESA42759.1 hypothetical protein NCU16728 [Neurospora crassa OR74A]|eukprot:XP_011394357.1 hypothetical protein NCU16728 [Neurospora crassa OR74A]
MPPLAFSANMVPAIRVKSTAAGRRIKFIKPLMNGNSWIICSAPTSRQWDWSSGPGISRKHPGVDLGQNSFIFEPTLCFLYTQGRDGRGGGQWLVNQTGKQVTE